MSIAVLRACALATGVVGLTASRAFAGKRHDAGASDDGRVSSCPLRLSWVTAIRLRAIIALVATSVGAMALGPAHAVDRATWQQCAAGDDASIAACNRIIANRAQETAQNLAIAIYNRGRVWQNKGDHARAIADFDDAIRRDRKNFYFFRQRGYSYFQKRDFDKAIADYDVAIRLNPKDAELRNQRAIVFAGKGEIDRAIAEYTAAIALEPRPVFFLNRGSNWQRKGDHARAIADFDDAIRRNAKDADFFQRRGFSHFQRNDFDKAIADYEEAIRLNPKDADLVNRRGIALGRKGESDRAIAAYDAAIALDARAVFFYNRGLAWQKKEDHVRAIADFDDAIRRDGKNADFFELRGLSHFQKRDFDKAIADYDEAIRLNPKDAGLLNRRGVALASKGDLDRAVSEYTAAIALGPTPTMFSNRGLVWQKKGDHTRALADFDEAIRRDGKNAGFFQQRAYSYFLKSDFDKAIAEYDEAIRLNPKDAMLLNYRAITFGRKGELDRAIAEYTAAIALDPRPLFFSNRGVDWQRKGDHVRAIADFDDAIRRDEKNADFLRYRAGSHLQRGDIDKAIADCDEAVRINPKSALIYSVRSGAFERKGELARAAVELEIALSLDPTQSRARASLERVRAAMAGPRREPVTEQAQRAPAVARDEKRVALVIGNSAYEAMPRLPNPANDAADMAAALRSLGFDVTLGLDLKRADMEDRLIGFAKAARTADAALVFYAGHGLQHQGINYLAPIDARISDEADLVRLVKVQALIQNLQGAKNAGILILDACRDNEAVVKLAASLPKSRAAGFRGGLAGEKADGIMVAFATQVDRLASDGTGRNSPFTTALLRHLPTKGLDARLVFARVRSDVLRETGDRQRPEVSDSLDGEFVFRR